MKYTITKEFRFEAAHALPHLPSNHKCHRLHGHSYKVVVAVSRCKLDKRGFVVDYADISTVVDPLIARLDHQNLNTIFPFKTTAEHLALWFHGELDGLLPVEYVEVYETPKTCCRVEVIK